MTLDGPNWLIEGEIWDLPYSTKWSRGRWLCRLIIELDHQIHINLRLYLQIPLNIRTLLYLEPSLTGINFLVIQYLLRVCLPFKSKVAKHRDKFRCATTNLSATYPTRRVLKINLSESESELNQIMVSYCYVDNIFNKLLFFNIVQTYKIDCSECLVVSILYKQ